MQAWRDSTPATWSGAGRIDVAGVSAGAVAPGLMLRVFASRPTADAPVARGDPVLAARWPAFAGEIPDMLPSFGPRPPRRWPATTTDSSPLVSGVGRAALREASMWLREEGSDPPVRGSAQIVEGHTGRAGSG